jgi:tRNA nucleotidyltransferase (CCA-adding enzyme)
MQLPPEVIALAAACKDAGGRAWVVGGRVRDALMGIASKDIDIEVHGIEATNLQSILETLGHVNEIGRSFGVFKVVIDKVELDVSIPRRDSQVGPRHKDVVVQGDPHMGIEEAARRRDLTINAIAFDPLTEDFADPFSGIRDLERGRLDAVDPMTFMEDPLRVLRVVQFASRFGFAIHDPLIDLCRSAQLTQLPAERIWAEIEKMLMRSPAPSIGWEAGIHTGAMSQVLPEAATQPREHIEAALDRAAELRTEMEHPGRATALMVAAMLHRAGPDGAKMTLDRMKLFRLHDYPVRARVLQACALWPTMAKPLSHSQIRTLAEETEVLLVGSVAWAVTGRHEALGNIDRAYRLGVAEAPLEPLLRGRDLKQIGIPNGPEMGSLLARLRTAQLAGDVADKESAIAWIQAARGEE